MFVNGLHHKAELVKLCKLWRDRLSLFRAGRPIFEEPKGEQEQQQDFDDQVIKANIIQRESKNASFLSRPTAAVVNYPAISGFCFG